MKETLRCLNFFPCFEATGGVWRTSHTKRIRGDAETTAFNYSEVRNAPLTHKKEYSEGKFWQYYEWFLKETLPVAEEKRGQTSTPSL